jgi:redox-sensitive bicupin YhaK (pirin superfamily)
MTVSRRNVSKMEPATSCILKNEAGSDGVLMRAEGATRALLIAGQPLREPIVQYGPFVMNTQAEIFKAINDFNDGRLINAE